MMTGVHHLLVSFHHRLMLMPGCIQLKSTQWKVFLAGDWRWLVRLSQSHQILPSLHTTGHRRGKFILCTREYQRVKRILCASDHKSIDLKLLSSAGRLGNNSYICIFLWTMNMDSFLISFFLCLRCLFNVHLLIPWRQMRFLFLFFYLMKYFPGLTAIKNFIISYERNKKIKERF